MKVSAFRRDQAAEVVELYTKVFSESEGKEEGASIGNLVSQLIETTNANDIYGFVAIQESIVGCIFFTRLTVPTIKDSFILSPVAIATDSQGQGRGQKLIRHGIEVLESDGVELVFTYGDPNYYNKVGFVQISEELIKAPLILSQPEGWLAQSLRGDSIPCVNGKTECVEALNRQVYW